jgi:hypothetical protein
MSMGFDSNDAIVDLLRKHKGDVNKVVNELLMV